MKNVARNPGYWISGVVLAIAGVAVARIVATQVAAPLRLPVTLGGQLLALAGLLLICVGVSRRIKRDTPRSLS